MNSRMNTAVLVAERDGDWNEWVEPLRGQADDIAIVLQRMDETPAELAMRVRERVAEVTKTGNLVAAALVGGESWDSDTLSARSLMIRALLGHMEPGSEGQLYLDSGLKRGRSRHAMMALASALSEQVSESISIVPTKGPLPAPLPARRAA